MQNKDNKVFRQAVTIVAVVALTTAIGVAVSAQMGSGRGQMVGPGTGGPGSQGMRGGPGMMGSQGGMGGPGIMGGPGRMGGQRGGPLGMLGLGMRELGVTDEQREQIRGKMESHQAEFESIAKRLSEARTALQEATTAETLNEAAIREAAAAVGAVEADAAVLRAKAHQDVFSVLTPEQKQKAKELREKMQQRMKEGRQRMKEGRRPFQQRDEQERGGSELV